MEEVSKEQPENTQEASIMLSNIYFTPEQVAIAAMVDAMDLRVFGHIPE